MYILIKHMKLFYHHSYKIKSWTITNNFKWKQIQKIVKKSSQIIFIVKKTNCLNVIQRYDCILIFLHKKINLQQNVKLHYAIEGSHFSTLNEILRENPDNEREIIKSLFWKWRILVVANTNVGTCSKNPFLDPFLSLLEALKKNLNLLVHKWSVQNQWLIVTMKYSILGWICDYISQRCNNNIHC